MFTRIAALAVAAVVAAGAASAQAPTRATLDTRTQQTAPAPGPVSTPTKEMTTVEAAKQMADMLSNIQKSRSEIAQTFARNLR